MYQKNGMIDFFSYFEEIVEIFKKLIQHQEIHTKKEIFHYLFLYDLLNINLLIGLNKEKLENNILYDKYYNENNFIKINKNLTNKNDIDTVIKMIRNSFEHCEYDLDIFNNIITISNSGRLGNSFFEAELNFNEFYKFVLKFYSNNIVCGIVQQYMYIISDSENISEKFILNKKN